MEPSKCENSSSGGSSSPNASSEASTAMETVEAGKINTLLDSVRERLTTDVFGQLGLKGQRLANDGRLVKLREVCELDQHLEEVKALMARKNEIATLAAAQEARKAAKPNALQLATVQDMISAALESGLRDVRIENERLKDRMSKAEEHRRKAEAEYATLQENIRKMKSGDMKGVRGFVKEEAGRGLREVFDQRFLEQRLAKLEKGIEKAALETVEHMGAVEWTLVNRISNVEQSVGCKIKQEVSDAKDLTHEKVESLRREVKNDFDKISKELLQSGLGDDCGLSSNDRSNGNAEFEDDDEGVHTELGDEEVLGLAELGY